MIGPLTVKLNAANPHLGLNPIYSYVGSPSSLRIIETPKKIGLWNIESVYVTVTYPDNQQYTVDAVKTADVWVCTIPASTVSGTSINGLVVYADACDERGNESTGYILGVGNMVILDVDGSLDATRSGTVLRLLDSIPETPMKGDVANIDGTMKIYDGENWQ